ncbi:MAG: ribokinase [Betaproteobacteria bacterium]
MIVVVGSINLDLTAGVDRFPHPGETIPGTSFAAVPGGKGANQALAARRAGAKVAMAGAVGTDGFAETALVGLVDAGVDIASVARIDGPSGIAMIQVDASGQNCITVIAGANGKVRASAIPDAAFGPGVTLLMQLEIPLATVQELAIRARRLAARVVLNAAPAIGLPPVLRDALDVLIVNEHEAAALAMAFGMPASPEAFAVAIHRTHRCATVVTQGSRGAVAVADGNLVSVGAPQVEVVDTTGAGDAFVGALVAALDRGTPWPRALAEGVAAGSLACQRSGAQAALPDASAIAGLASTVEPRVACRALD